MYQQVPFFFFGAKLGDLTHGVCDTLGWGVQDDTI